MRLVFPVRCLTGHRDFTSYNAVLVLSGNIIVVAIVFVVIVDVVFIVVVVVVIVVVVGVAGYIVVPFGLKVALEDKGEHVDSVSLQRWIHAVSWRSTW